MVPRVRFWILVPALVPVVVPRLAGQEPRFADALIVPNRTGEQARGCCALRRGEISGRGVTLRQLIEAAHRRHPFDRREVIGGPWLDEGRYDFRAQVAGGHVYDRSGFPGQTFAMLRSYLANKARVRAEMRERSVYLLTVKDANALGPRLGRSDRDCGGDMRARERGEPIAGAPCGASPYPGRIAARGIGMPDLAALITPWVDQPVVDRTGLGGLFDVDLEGVEVRPAGPFGPSYRPSDTTRSLFEMLPEQLGLQLEPATAAIEVLVVEPIAKPAAPVDAIQGILDAFRTHAVVALCDPHGSQQLHDFLVSVVRDPRLPGTVNDIVIEGANARYQELVDRFIAGGDVPVEALRPVWQDSTRVQFVLDPPLYTEVLPAIRAANAHLAPERKRRVLLGDPPIDWAIVKTPLDHRRWIERRDSFPADLIRREVLARKRRALLVFGQMHFRRKNAAANFTSDGLAGHDCEPARGRRPHTRVYDLVGGSIRPAPVEYDGPRFAIRDGQPDFIRPIPRAEWRSIRAEDQYYLGPSTARLTPSKALCADTVYLQRRRDRLALVFLLRRDPPQPSPLRFAAGIISTPTRFPGSWRASGRDGPNSLTRACGSSATAATRTDFAELGPGPNLAFR